MRRYFVTVGQPATVKMEFMGWLKLGGVPTNECNSAGQTNGFGCLPHNGLLCFPVYICT